MVRGMTLIRSISDAYSVRDTVGKPDLLVETFIIKEDMVVLAVVTEYTQKGARAGRGGTRKGCNPRRERDGVKLIE
jgi:hypothetical protein